MILIASSENPFAERDCQIMFNLPGEDCRTSDELGCYKEELKVGQRREAELDELWQVVKAWDTMVELTMSGL